MKKEYRTDDSNSFGSGAAGVGQPLFAFYLKAHKHPKYTLAQINNYPTATAGVMVIFELVYAFISDGPLNGRRWPVMLFSAVRRTVSHGLFPRTNLLLAPQPGLLDFPHGLEHSGMVALDLLHLYPTGSCPSSFEPHVSDLAHTPRRAIYWY